MHDVLTNPRWICIDWRLLRKQMLLHHQGDMLFKGVNQGMAIYQLTIRK